MPWLSGPAFRQLEELAAWGEMLKSGMIVAFTADAKETHLEGNYWLALIEGPAHPHCLSRRLWGHGQGQGQDM